MNLKIIGGKLNIQLVSIADFECFTQPIDSCQPSNEKSFTEKYQKHTPSGFCIYPVCAKGIEFQHEPILVTLEPGKEDLGVELVDACENLYQTFYDKFRYSKEIVMNCDDEFDYETSTICWLCEKEIDDNDPKNYKVRDHCHYTGKYRGPAHNKCNLAAKNPKFVPILFHNLSGYDAHLFIKSLGKTDGAIDVIANNEEKYISFSKTLVVDSYIDGNGKLKEVKRKLRFLDSFKFMASPLDNLVSNLTKCGKCNTCSPPACIHRYIENGKIIQDKSIGNCTRCINCLLIGKPCITPTDSRLVETKKYFKDTSLLMRKGVYPYDYMNCIEKFNDTELPAKELFYNKLNDTHISDDDYQHAQNIWNHL